MSDRSEPVRRQKSYKTIAVAKVNKARRADATVVNQPQLGG